MKKLILSITAVVLVFVLGCGEFLVNATPSDSPEPTSQDYCPSGYVCVATNMTAKGFGLASGKPLSGIAVYKKGNDVIAYVPGHGHLSCYWDTSGATGWHFDANDGVYVINNLRKDI